MPQNLADPGRKPCDAALALPDSDANAQSSIQIHAPALLVLSALPPLAMVENRCSGFANLAKPSLVDCQLFVSKARSPSQKASTPNMFTQPFLFYNSIVGNPEPSGRAVRGGCQIKKKMRRKSIGISRMASTFSLLL